jgi:hypothetical protein
MKTDENKEESKPLKWWEILWLCALGLPFAAAIYATVIRYIFWLFESSK